MNDVRRVHLVRHGKVHNPTGIVYGVEPGFHLSHLGRAQAMETAGYLVANYDIGAIFSSPMERCLETATALQLSLPKVLKVNVRRGLIESTGIFSGHKMGAGRAVLRDPANVRRLWNPYGASWGDESYEDLAWRVHGVVQEAMDGAHGADAVLYSHQLTIWTYRMLAEGRPFAHNPANRQCDVASVTTLEFTNAELTSIHYSNPASVVSEADSGVA